MNNGMMPAMPLTFNPGEEFIGTHPGDGMTKREYFSALAMQGFMSNWDHNLSPDDYAYMAIKQADALIAALGEK